MPYNEKYKNTMVVVFYFYKIVFNKIPPFFIYVNLLL